MTSARGTLNSSAAPLEAFAERFLPTIQPGARVRAEPLAEAFREAFGLPAFPKEADLHRVMRELRVTTKLLPQGAPMDGLNLWHPRTGVEIFLREDLSRARTETTLSHELREVLENAFKRTDRSYKGIETHNNDRMNPESDRFAAYLLMQTEPSQQLFMEVGFDPVQFAYEAGRSLASVIIRMQTLFPIGCTVAAPVAGYWLYEAPWQAVREMAATSNELVARDIQALNGFSLAKSRVRSQRAAAILPASRSRASEIPEIEQAIAERRATANFTAALDLFGDEQYLLVAEPVFYGATPWKVVLAAVRKESIPLVRPWLARANLLGRHPFSPSIAVPESPSPSPR